MQWLRNLWPTACSVSSCTTSRYCSLAYHQIVCIACSTHQKTMCSHQHVYAERGSSNVDTAFGLHFYTTCLCGRDGHLEIQISLVFLMLSLLTGADWACLVLTPWPPCDPLLLTGTVWARLMLPSCLPLLLSPPTPIGTWGFLG